jgi:hypothetical protein
LETPTNTPPTAPFTLAWRAPIHPEHERGVKWYIYGSIFVLACAIYGIFSGAWTFSVAIVVAAGLYYLVRKAPAVVKSIQLTEQGVTYDGEFTQWNDVSSFWVVATPAYNELHIMRKKGLNREIVIQLSDIGITPIRATLSQVIQEQSDRGERFLDLLIRICKL